MAESIAQLHEENVVTQMSAVQYVAQVITSVKPYAVKGYPNTAKLELIKRLESREDTKRLTLDSKAIGQLNSIVRSPDNRKIRRARLKKVLFPKKTNRYGLAA